MLLAGRVAFPGDVFDAIELPVVALMALIPRITPPPAVPIQDAPLVETAAAALTASTAGGATSVLVAV